MSGDVRCVSGFYDLPTPCYIVDESLITKNLEVLKSVQEQAECKILLAQKAFSMFSLYPLIAKYLSGSAASGLYEARLGHDFMGGETHIFSPAYKEEDFDEILRLCDHIVFNSLTQTEQFGRRAAAAGKQAGLRINPECSTQEHAIYDPCAPFSRLGVTAEKLTEGLPEYISGLHFHTLCEQNSDALEITVNAVEKKFGHLLKQINWINLGGGHHITRKDYDIPRLVKIIQMLRVKYGIEVYLEPGEAVALNAGFLAATVIDIVHNGMDIAILDASAACHMPDVIEMPYRPNVIDAALPNEKNFTYRLAGPTCLAGDVIGDYSFDKPLKIGDKIVFCDMAIYSMVKNNTFNGMPLPAIVLLDSEGKFKIIKQFGYDDFKSRLS